MKWSILTLCMAAFFCCHAFTQSYNNNWMLGDSTGLNFTSGFPEPVSSSIVCFEASATISDIDGNLLFYTNGVTVWNSEHEMMENGDSLEINTIPGLPNMSSTTQGVIILTKPGNGDQYYIIYLGGGIKYALVDMTYNSGLGEVLLKNEFLTTDSIVYTEKMHAVKHANGRDWWLTLIEWPEGGDEGFGNHFQFIQILITPSGFSEPVYQDAGIFQENDGIAFLGQMKFSLDGSKVIVTRGTAADLFDFDRCTGAFSNHYAIEDIINTFTYGCEFSPDNTKVYIASDGGSDYGKIFQFCLNCDEDISETKTLIYDNGAGGSSIGAGIYSFQIGPDEKIYIPMPTSSLEYSDSTEQNLNLSVINSPNDLGLSCDLDTLTIWLGGKRSSASLPNMPNYNLGALTGSPCDTLTADTTIAIQNNESGGGLTIYPNPAGNSIILQSAIPLSGIVYIYDVNGVEVFTTKIKQEKTNAIDVSFLARGLYTVKIVREGNENKTAKFVKQ